MNSNPFDEDYFIRGPETGKSNYVDYRWMPERTIPFAESLKRFWGSPKGASFMDFGCARGYTVKAMRMVGFLGFGYDISDWAIGNCDPDVKPYIGNQFFYPSFDYILAKDVLEHISPGEIEDTMDTLVSMVRKRLLIIVPLAGKDGKYIREEDRSDATHQLCWPIENWLYLASASAGLDDAIVSASWHIPGLKPASRRPFKSCGFIEVRKD